MTNLPRTEEIAQEIIKQAKEAVHIAVKLRQVSGNEAILDLLMLDINSRIKQALDTERLRADGFDQHRRELQQLLDSCRTTSDEIMAIRDSATTRAEAAEAMVKELENGRI